MAPIDDVLVLSLSAFLGNVGVALAGFGMAIVYLFVWQVAVLFGYDSDFKYAVFIQALALFSAQPLLLKKAEIREHASRRILLYFIPITILSTPVGQIAGDRVSTDLVEAVGGILVTFVAIFEVYQKRNLFAAWYCSVCLLQKTSTLGGENISETKSSVEDFSKEPCGQSTIGNDKEDPEVDESSTASTSSTARARSFGCLYRLEQLLGEGAYSTVKVGVHKQSGDRVAVKIVDKAILLEPEETKLQEEVDLIRTLNHPHLLLFHDVFDEPERYFIVTEMMEGGDLLSKLSSVSFFQEKEANRICRQILGAVDCMHSQRIAHRDLKPENVLLGSENDNPTVKLADFGFAKKETSPDSFTTMCGTPAYVAPEILSALRYGLKVDMWSIGVLLFALLGGYQPFQGDDEDQVKSAIRAGQFEFHETHWKHVSKEAKSLIRALLNTNVLERLSVTDALRHPWFGLDFTRSVKVEEAVPVFFMVGSQRSGSNWLRTMLDQREDLAGPHPPHIMREFMPIMDKFGDLSLDNDNYRIMVDHVCTFVERNQVPWTDKHGNPIIFHRMTIYDRAEISCRRIVQTRQQAGNAKPLDRSLYLLAVFDSIMYYYTKANGKMMWLCKSMGMAQFHSQLLEFYGQERLRYIYLVRDPRDVAMSFMKTPVGDCHYHAIISKWTKLQQVALNVLEEAPHLVHKVHYETILKEKENVVKRVYQFIGERRFGGVKRQASVMFMKPTEDLISGAKGGREAKKAQRLSFQFENLGRGPSFAATQHQKWRDPVAGLTDADLQLLESVAHEMMVRLGYECHLVGKVTEATKFNETDLKLFAELNRKGIEKMIVDLKSDNPGDFDRRQKQAEVLGFEPTSLWSWTNSDDSSCSEELRPSTASFLSLEDLAGRFEARPEFVVDVPSQGGGGEAIAFRIAAVTQRGYYPNDHAKPNQDASEVRIGDDNNRASGHWLAVLDGHGPDGHKCASFVSNALPELFNKYVAAGAAVKSALEKAHQRTHDMVLAQDDIDTEQSGTTSTTLLIQDDGRLLVSNVGDSTCILGSSRNGRTKGSLLCTEHTPFRKDELERVKRSGALIMTVDQRDGLEPMHENWDPADPPPRVWSANPTDKFPGCGFTRSIGDAIAHTLGVTARPDIFEYQVKSQDRVIILASDGVTEWLDEQDCVDIVCKYPDQPTVAARELVREASKRWISRDDYMDDITAIVLFFNPEAESPYNSKEDVEWGRSLTEPVEIQSAVEPLGLSARLWTLCAGAASGFLGGLCGIRGPPIILYFLHPPYPVSFTKKTQRATGAFVTATNVIMRVAFYLVDVLAFDGDDYFRGDDWLLYACVMVSSLGGVLIGSKLFENMQDSKDTIRGILAIFLLLCGISLLLSTFAEV